jgi:hypothetical protein
VLLHHDCLGVLNLWGHDLWRDLIATMTSRAVVASLSIKASDVFELVIFLLH